MLASPSAAKPSTPSGPEKCKQTTSCFSNMVVLTQLNIRRERTTWDICVLLFTTCGDYTLCNTNTPITLTRRSRIASRACAPGCRLSACLQFTHPYSNIALAVPIASIPLVLQGNVQITGTQDGCAPRVSLGGHMGPLQMVSRTGVLKSEYSPVAIVHLCMVTRRLMDLFTMKQCTLGRRTVTSIHSNTVLAQGIICTYNGISCRKVFTVGSAGARGWGLCGIIISPISYMYFRSAVCCRGHASSGWNLGEGAGLHLL